MNKLKNVATEILDILEKRRQELELTFVEDTHTYTMKNSKGELKSDWPSVSKIMKLFYTEFDSEGISLKKANGDLEVQQQLLDEENLMLKHRIKQLEEALEATAMIIGPPGHSEWATDDEINRAWGLYIQTKEIKP